MQIRKQYLVFYFFGSQNHRQILTTIIEHQWNVVGRQQWWEVEVAYDEEIKMALSSVVDF